MTEPLSPLAARRVFLTLTTTRWLPIGFVVGLLVLWQLERGLTLPPGAKLSEAEVAAQMGVSTAAMAQTLLVATLGDAEANLAKFNAGDEQIPIMVRLNGAARRDLMAVRDLRVPSSAGPVPLEAVADIGLSAGATGVRVRVVRSTLSQVLNKTEPVAANA